MFPAQVSYKLQLRELFYFQGKEYTDRNIEMWKEYVTLTGEAERGRICHGFLFVLGR